LINATPENDQTRSRDTQKGPLTWTFTQNQRTLPILALAEALANPSRPVTRLLDLARTWDNVPDDLPTQASYRTIRQLKVSDVDEMVALYDPAAGMGVKQLAARLGVHRSTVGKFLKARGIDTRPTLKPEQVPAAAALYRSGLTLGQVADYYGLSYSTVREKLVEAG
jgi:hypothetical protein